VLRLELAGAETVAAQGEAVVGPAESE
jgi:hypothetical protein